ncbi:hypothetical protein DINM_020585 [Dirofilaria immitis]|nr:hypothetical protein [Dirofilaria immitis]
MDNRNYGNIWQHGFTLSQTDEYHHVEDASIPVLRDPIRDATTSSFLFWDYDPTFRTNIGQTVSGNFAGPHYIVPLSQMSDSSSNFSNLPIRQMITTAAPIYSSSCSCTVKDFTVPLSTRFPSDQSYSLLSFDTPNTLSTLSIPQQTTPRSVPPVAIQKQSVNNYVRFALLQLPMDCILEQKRALHVLHFSG